MGFDDVIPGFDDFIKVLIGAVILVFGITFLIFSFDKNGRRFKKKFGSDNTLKISSICLIILGAVIVYTTLFMQ